MVYTEERVTRPSASLVGCLDKWSCRSKSSGNAWSLEEECHKRQQGSEVNS